MSLDLPQTVPARRAIEEALQALQECEDVLAGTAEPGEASEYAKGAAAAARAIRSALNGLLIWHGASPSGEAPLAELGRRATQLDSMLRTPLQRARPVEGLARALAGKSELSLNEREAALMSYYTARNTVRTVLNALPEVVVPEAQLLR